MTRALSRRAAAGARAGPAWVAALLEWYGRNRRPLPWRATADAYRVWLSEVMLQQTRVETVIPYYRRFLQRFPTLRALAAAAPDDVLKAWEGLGYYSRARSLHGAARLWIGAGRQQPPTCFAELLVVPGIGSYTAAAVASIAGGEAVPVVDGNVMRVFTRLRALPGDPRKPALRRAIFTRLAAVLSRASRARPTLRPGDFNQALMELGATVCLPRQPHCPACPVAARCAARRRGCATAFPQRTPRPAGPHHEVAVGVIWRRGRVLVQRRPETGLLGGLWEFPGGKRQAGEPLPETVRREVAEETGLTVRVEAAYGSLEHAYSHFSITLTAFRCTWQGGRVRRRGGATAARWVRPAALSGFAMPRANRRVLAWLGLAAAAEGAPSGPVQVPSSSVRRGSMARPLAGRRAASSRARNRS